MLMARAERDVHQATWDLLRNLRGLEGLKDSLRPNGDTSKRTCLSEAPNVSPIAEKAVP